ncbi:alpha/beta fold hydrolase [Nakamurella lactea]|uniref:alpha/beta fold hydrolase n=1 Tax=Nakamurella lactea TaxID=459515 RepID=UPI0004003D44|nr:alpha/beta fold hydrolase [Nakamurella lactea]
MVTAASPSSPPLEYVRTDDGVTLAYAALGDGPTLIWLPSLGNLVAQWRVPLLRNAYQRLAERFRLVLYDGRGTGSSDRRIDPAGLGLDGQLRDLSAVVDAVGPAPVALIGYYHSVPAAVAFAAAHPRRVSRLALFGGSLRLRDSMSPQQTQALLSLIDQDWDLFAQTAAHTWLGWGAGESSRLVADAFRTAATPTTAAALFAAAADVDVSARAPAVQAPVLVLHRQSEKQIPVEMSRQLADALPNGTLLVLPGSTPTLFFENPDEDLDTVSRFLLGAPPAAGGPPNPDGLTAREIEVLRLLAGGGSNQQIGSGLGISVHTVERHAGNLYRKIGARGRADATAYAVRRGLV